MEIIMYEAMWTIAIDKGQAYPGIRFWASDNKLRLREGLVPLP